jgi:outer membrane receptor for Fe3+-dicitrate
LRLRLNNNYLPFSPMNFRPVLSSAVVSSALAISLWHTSRAQEEAETLQPLTVVGSQAAVFELPGSAAYAAAEEFRERGYTNIAQIAARVPGVYVRDEDGSGNFPNISLRGVDGNRSTKVTMMEDGILTAPAPYSAPNAYYAPKAGRMAGIEFLKGSSQVKYGPQTTGGVVNYRSTEFPEVDGPKFYNRTTYGSHNTIFEHAWHGDAQDTAAGKIGWLLEMHGEHSDGYREIEDLRKTPAMICSSRCSKCFGSRTPRSSNALSSRSGFPTSMRTKLTPVSPMRISIKTRIAVMPRRSTMSSIPSNGALT